MYARQCSETGLLHLSPSSFAKDEWACFRDISTAAATRIMITNSKEYYKFHNQDDNLSNKEHEPQQKDRLVWKSPDSYVDDPDRGHISHHHRLHLVSRKLHPWWIRLLLRRHKLEKVSRHPVFADRGKVLTRKQPSPQHVRLHLEHRFPYSMVYRSVHGHLPDRQISQAESTRHNDAHNANHPQCLYYNRLPYRTHGVVVCRQWWLQKSAGLLWNNHCYVSS